MMGTAFNDAFRGKKDQAFKDALSRTVASAVRPYAVLGAVLYAMLDIVFVITGLVTGGPVWAPQILADAATIVWFITVAVLASAHRLTSSGQVYRYAAALLIPMHLNVGLQLLAHGNPDDLTNLGLIVIGTTPLTLRWRGWVASNSAVLVAMGCFAAVYTGPPWWTQASLVLTSMVISFAWMISQRAVVARLERSAEARRAAAVETTVALRQLSSIAEAVQDAIVTVAQDGRVTGWNAASEQMFGRTRADALGRDALDLLMPDHDRPRRHAWLAEMLNAPELPAPVRPIEIPVIGADGHETTAEFSLGFWEGDGVRYCSAVIRDLTERHSAEAARRDSAAAEVRRQSALQVHDNVVQGLSVGLYALESGDQASAEEALRGTLVAARRIISEALDDGDVLAVLAAMRADGTPALAPKTSPMFAVPPMPEHTTYR